VKRMAAPVQFLVGLVLRAVLNRGGVRGGRRLPAGAPRRTPRTAADLPERAAPSVRRRPLGLLMFGSLAVGMGLMLIFEHWVTRVVGVAALFAFIVSGVFLIADPAFLAEDDES
jgi:hypothetical protein